MPEQNVIGLPIIIVLTTDPAERQQDNVGRYCRLWLASSNKSRLNYMLIAAVELLAGGMTT